MEVWSWHTEMLQNFNTSQMVLHGTQGLILTWDSNQEVEYSEEPGFLYFIKYRVAGGTRCFPLYHILHWDISLSDCEWTFHFSAHLSPDSCFLHVIFKFTFSGKWIAWCTINLSSCKYKKSSNITESVYQWKLLTDVSYIYLWCRDDFLTIATTRPETLFGDVAVAVNPEVWVLQFSCLLLQLMI